MATEDIANGTGTSVGTVPIAVDDTGRNGSLEGVQCNSGTSGQNPGERTSLPGPQQLRIRGFLNELSKMSNAERDALISDANKYNFMHPSLTRKAVGLSEAEFLTLAPSVGGKAPPVLQPTLPTMQKAPAAASLSEEDDDVQSFKQWKQLMNKKLHDKSDPVYVPEALGSSAKKLKKQHEEERARRLREIRGITSSADDCESESESDDEWEGVSLKPKNP